MKLHLQLSLDRLGPIYQTDKPYYSLMVSAALEPETGESVTAGDVSKLLALWNWEKFPKLSVFGRPKDATKPWKVLDKELLTDTEPSGLAALRNALDGELADQLKTFQPVDFIWAPDPQNSAIEVKTMNASDKPRMGRDWRAFLSHVATYPGGLGIHLRLCLYFFLKEEPAADTIVLAAPNLRIPFVDSGGAAHVIVASPRDPTGGGNPIHSLNVPNLDPDSLFRWEYETTESGLVVDGFVNAPKPVDNDAKSLINIQTLWRNTAQLGPGVDWLAQLQDAVAPALNLPEQIARYLRKLDTAAPPSGIKTTFRLALFESIRPAVDVKRVPPQSRSLLETILFHFAKPSDFQFPVSMPSDWEVSVPDPVGTSFDYARVLERHWGEFSENGSLVKKIIGLWKAAYQAAGWDAIEKAVTPLLEDTVLPSRLPVHNVGLFWKKLFPTGETGIGEEESKTKGRLQDGVVKFAKSALTTVDSELENILRMQTGLAFDRAKQQLTGDATSDGITLQVDKVDAAADPNSADDHMDYLRQISGAGVLLRRESSNEWRFLNLAQIHVRVAAANPAKVGDPVAAPVRFQYAAGVRQPFLTYQNQPLTAQSPWAGMAPTREGTDKTKYPIDVPLISSKSPYSATGLKLERLMYGEKYRAAVFYMGNAGNLPAELAVASGSASAIPWRFKIPGKDDPKGAVSIHYRRRCPISPLRTEQDPSPSARAFPPVLPEDVHPLTRSLLVTSDVNDIESGPVPERPPLLVLLPSSRPAGVWEEDKGSASATFVLRPPAIDPKVWERWQADNVTALRAKVLAQVFQLLNDRVLGRRTQEDPTLDDPAVAAFTISFERLFPNKTQIAGAKEFDFGKPKGVDGLASQQRTGKRILIQSGAVSSPDATDRPADNTVVVTIPDAEVWRIDFTPVVVEQSRFEIPVSALMAPLSMHVEIAAPLFTTANQLDRNKALHESISISPASGKPPMPVENEEEVHIDLSGIAIKSFQHLIHRTEVLAQRWRWDGRPVYEDPLAKELVSGFPFASLTEPPPDFAADGMLFADRADTDYTIIPGFVDLASTQSKNRLHTLKVTALPSVLYYRFAVRAFSRYEGLLLRRHLLDSNVTGAGGTARRWKRHILPLRWRERVPKPLIKLMVPVTETFGGKDATAVAPGWLVMMEESWFDERMAGLGEILESRIDNVALPDDPSVTRYEFGPDPVIDMTADPFEGAEPKAPRPLGPTGLTFDTDASAPLFIRSAFFQPAPLVTGDEKRDLSFHFVKLRFRRVLAGADEGQPRTSSLASDWTDPFWVQVLPPANRWRMKKGAAAEEWAHTDELSLASDGRSVLYKDSRATLLPVSKDTAFSSFRLYGLVTRAVFDAFGRADQESFVSFTPLDTLPAPPSVTPQELRLRVVEVQFRIKVAGGVTELIGGDPMPADLPGLLAALFPGHADFSSAEPPSKDAQGRIVRISPALRVKL